MIDKSKQYRTRDGREVRIYAVDVCGICHRDGVITRLRADNERLTRQFAEHADRTADDTAALRDENERLRAANRDVMLHWDVLKADYERLRAALDCNSLIEVKPRIKREVWVNVYRQDDGYEFATYHDNAIDAESESGDAIVARACLAIDVEEGEGL